MGLFSLNSTYGPTAWVVSGVVFFFLLEYVIPFRANTYSKFQRWRINFSLQLCNIVIVDLIFFALLTKIRIFSGEHHLDVYNRLPLTAAGRGVLTVVLFDFITYCWHRLNHEIPFLWRFHKVHHTDRNIDVSSAARFHFGEITISTVIMYSLMLVMGATIFETRVFQVILALMNQFEHSNIKLWKPLERTIWWVLVPPSMHKIHHSDEQEYTDSNYGTIFSVWDRLLGTLKSDLKQDKIIFGLKEYPDENDLRLRKLLVLPFKKRERNKDA